ncbi:flagellar assembly peptidoglycan hydrolase FlgJ [uncultured Ramlibacter sp.]|uniref:flagellar assembly peptidoglycan hydrolase FlgJ n=1 Tax=uncultured Ramlibacter sp. TaxID=260755 RepID=UPI002625D620|nr:flagellar assembly peptidoglycan hydrolase FlgJ [uncultured Ramlibacter sp.]
MVADSTRSSLGIDSRSLDALRNEASRDPKAAAHQAAVQFESLFMQQVLKSMRAAGEPLKAEGSTNAGNDTFTSMLDSQMAKQFAGRTGGLGEMIEKQLTRHMQSLPAVSPENQAAATAAAAAVATQQAAPAASPVSQGAAGGSKQSAFIQRLLPHAKAAEAQTGVPASFILGQAALESGWGKGEIRNADGSPSFNLFGVKATGWKGATAAARTTEYVDGQAVKQTEKFRSYGSYTDAFADYARMLSNSPRYASVVRNATSAESFAGGMQRAGYATDPRYASKLAQTINHTLNLQRALG